MTRPRYGKSAGLATVAAPTGKRVAIVGSGPTGLTAAYYLASRKGHSVTIFERLPELGRPAEGRTA